MDAGENPATRYEAPANISADSKEPADVAYLNYLNAVMDKDAVEDTEKGETVVNPDGILYMTANSSQEASIMILYQECRAILQTDGRKTFRLILLLM